MLKKLAAVFALLLMVGAAQAATFVWGDDFNGTSLSTAFNGWNDNGNCTVAGGIVKHAGGNDIHSRYSWPINQTYTYEFSYRIPDYDPANSATSWAQTLEKCEQPAQVKPYDTTRNNARFEVYMSGDNHHRFHWMTSETTSGDADLNVPVSSFYSANFNTAFQNVKFVIGPSVQAGYVNGKLIWFTRLDLSARTELMQVAFKGGSASAPYTGTEWDYIRVFQGDASGNPVANNLLFWDGFDQTLWKKPSDGFRQIGQYWSNDAAQPGLGAGYTPMNVNDWDTRVRHFAHDGAGWFNDMTTTFNDDITLEVNMRWPGGTIGTAGDQYERWCGFGEGGNSEGDNKVMIRQGCGGGKPLCVLFRSDAKTDEGSNYRNIWSAFTAPASWSKINIVYNHNNTSLRVFVNDVQAFYEENCGFTTTKALVFGLRGQNQASNPNIVVPSMDYYKVLRGYWVPVELSTFDVE